MLETIARTFRGLTGAPPPNPMLTQYESMFTDFDQKRPLADYEFVVLDTELTGLSPRTDEVVSLGAVKIRNFQITADSFYTLVAPKAAIPKVSTLIHRITPDQVKDSPRLRQVLPKFLTFCGKALFVGHNVGLDMSFLNRSARDILGGKLQTPCLDTMRLAMVYEAELWETQAEYEKYNTSVSYQLGDLTDKYGLPSFNQHNALYDAMQTAYLFLYLVKKLHSGGIETLHDLYMAGRSWRWYF